MSDGDVEGDPIARSLERPTAAAAASAVDDALSRGRVVTLVGECEMARRDGDRRASGVHHLLVKPDGTVVVHGRDGTAPVAELSAEEGLEVNAIGDALRIDVGAGPDGHHIRFDRVAFLASAAVEPTTAGSGDEEGSERHADLRSRLVADPDLVEPGFRPLATERETGAGPIDLFGRDDDGRAVVVEVKAHRAGPAAVGQLDRYVAALRRDLHAAAEVRGILIAPSATQRARALLDERGFEFRALSSEAA